MKKDRWTLWFDRIQSALVFFVGLGGIVNEMKFEPDPRETLVILFGGMIGYPFAVVADRLRKEGKR